MKNKFLYLLLAAALAAPVAAENLVILTTNDTHSNIDSDAKGAGGILPRKAIIDSVRNAEKNVFLVDAGDMVQGSLYFKYFRGDVEYPLFNMMDYDVRILGNHEFDNGLEELAKHWRQVKADRLSANYDFSGTVADGIFKPYVIKKIAGKKVGFIGINVDPESLISKENYAGMKFLPVIKTANETAAYLRDKKKCDLIVAVTHIGYGNDNGAVNDRDLAKASKDIDIIIGGHSHTFVDPATPDKNPYWVDNAEGVPVLVTQTGKYGKNVGYIKIDLDRLKSADRKSDITYRYIPVTDRFPESKLDKRMISFLQPYKDKVDSVNNLPIGESRLDMKNNQRTGALANFTADMALSLARHTVDSLRLAGVEIPDVDLAVMNVGGIRQNMPLGNITEGQILSTYPFSNKMQIISMKGRSIIDALAIAARKGGESVSGNIRVLTDDDGNLLRVVIDDNVMDPEKDYAVATIDYIAEGNDDLTPMANHTTVWRDSEELSYRVLQYIKRLTEMGVPVAPDTTPRFQKAVKL